MGNRKNIYYGINADDKWFFYLVSDFSIIPLKECENKLNALFVYNVLLSKKLN